MTPLSTTTAYVPVAVTKEMPQTNCNYTVLLSDGTKTEGHLYNGRWYDMVDEDGENITSEVTHWLKETTGYLLSKTELEALLRDTFEAGMTRQEFLDGNLTTLSAPTGREQYIKQILP